MAPLHLLHYVGTLEQGGEQRYVIRVANGLRRAGFEQTIAYNWGDTLRDEIDPAIRCVRLLARDPATRLGELPSQVAFARLVGDADVVTTHSAGMWMILASVSAAAFGVPVVHTIQRTTGLHARTEDVVRRSMLLRRGVYGLVDRFVALSDYYRYDQIHRWGIPAEKVVLNYMGVDLARMRPDESVRAAVRAELGYGPEHVVFVLVARQSPEKGVPRALRAFAAIRAGFVGARMLLVGGGPSFEEHVRLAAELGLADSTRFLGARLDAERFVQAADVVMQATRSPHNGISSIEGMALSKPTLTVVDGAEERRMAEDTCEDGVNGFVFCTTDSAPSVAHVLKCIAEPGRLEAMGAASRAKAERLFDLAAHVERLAELYGSLGEARRRRRKSSAGGS